VPSLAARDRRARAAAFAGLTVAAASRPVPPAPASTWRRDIGECRRGGRSEFSGTLES
jgi:hypothetical protein